MYVCLCNAITKEEFEDTVRASPDKQPKEIMELLGIAKGCGACINICMHTLIETEPEEEEYYDA